MRRPSIEHLPVDLAGAAQAVAAVLQRAGRRAWLVGGAVRDLALEVAPKDVDLASAALPGELENLFSSTYSVGRAFGTVVVRQGTIDVQVTTFRSEEGYEDARRPSRVRFAESLEVDAGRRDFTCNALYLDPLSNELVDPMGGLADLDARRLRCVGEPRRRFGEDGLRLLRLARFAAQYALIPDDQTRAGAQASLEALRGVSPERILGELQRMAEGAAPGAATRLMFGLGLLGRLPGGGALGDGDCLAQRVDAVERLEARSFEGFLATLFRPSAEPEETAALAGIRELRPSRAIQQSVGAVFQCERAIGSCLAEFARGAARRSSWIRLVRRPEFELALAVWEAWHPGLEVQACKDLQAAATALAPEELWPAALVTSAELARAGIPRGPRWSELLVAAEEAQLDGRLTDEASARAWLEARARD